MLDQDLIKYKIEIMQFFNSLIMTTMVAILDNLLDQQFTLGLCLIFRFNSMQIQPLLSRKLIVSFNEICHFFVS